MTLYHFGNCLALIYAPYHMAYKFAGISEYSSLSKCVYAGTLYIFTQLCKMLLLATFFPDSDSSHIDGEYNIFLEFLKATVDFADLVGLYFALNSVQGKGHAKILTAAIGWSAAEVVVTRSVGLWTGARGAEFSWRHVVGAGAAQLSLAATGAAAALLWLRARSDLPAPLKTPATVLLVITPYRRLLEDGISWWFSCNWLVARALFCLPHALASLALYANMQAAIGN